VQVVWTPTRTEPGTQTTEVLVVRWVAVRAKWPLLPVWSTSPE
jgi:hypothetical protein